MKYAAVLLIALSLTTVGCWRNPRLLPGMYITHDGRVEAASPSLVRLDWQQRLQRSITASFELAVPPEVLIKGEPQANTKGYWQWSALTVQVHTPAAIAGTLHQQDLQDVVSETMQSVLVPCVQPTLSYTGAVGSETVPETE